ncbi:MAG: YicC family protein [Pirellulales bacterium]|nr:YicC family protein [Pirellulales bacterium]
MTGYGEAQQEIQGLAVAIEVRTINARYFKFSYRATDGYAALERRIETIVREQVRRGTVQVQLRVDRPHTPDDYRINVNLLERFRSDLVPLAKQWDKKDSISLESLLGLPGAVEEVACGKQYADEDWPLIQSCLNDALALLVQMRTEEGALLAADLTTNCNTIRRHLDLVQDRAPAVVNDYRDRLAERVGQSLLKLDISVEPADFIREVSLFSERADISEEIVRLHSHLQQFASVMNNEESAGRKLEFIAQEMGREINTIGSKANDTEIALHVVEMKTALERIREQIQNVE